MDEKQKKNKEERIKLKRGNAICCRVCKRSTEKFRLTLRKDGDGYICDICLLRRSK